MKKQEKDIYLGKILKKNILKGSRKEKYCFNEYNDFVIFGLSDK